LIIKSQQLTPLVLIRADASAYIGTGHVMRCLALAFQLQQCGYNVGFISRIMPQKISQLIEEHGMTICWLQPVNGSEQVNWLADNELLDAQQVVDVVRFLKPQWVVADNYGIGSPWEQQVSSEGGHLLVIDDLANRTHHCDLLLDQNYVPNFTTRYDKWGLTQARGLYGPEFVLLRSAFSEARSSLESYQHRLNKQIITICFGGSDPSNETMKALIGLLQFDNTFDVNVIVGGVYRHYDALTKLASNHHNVTIFQQANNIELHLANSFLAIGAVGTMTWERCCLGVPSIVASIANNQLTVAKYLDKMQYHNYIGHSDQIDADDYANAVKNLMNDTNQLFNQHERVSLLIDGLGAKRVVSRMRKVSGNN